MNPGQLEEELFLALLASGHCAKLRAYGTSMLPWIWPGDTVTLEPPPFEFPSLAEGDVVLARAGACLRLHRVVVLEEERAVLKGDSEWELDPPVKPSEVLGRVISVEGRGWGKAPLSGASRVLGKGAAKISWATRLRRLPGFFARWV